MCSAIKSLREFEQSSGTVKAAVLRVSALPGDLACAILAGVAADQALAHGLDLDESDCCVGNVVVIHLTRKEKTSLDIYYV